MPVLSTLFRSYLINVGINAVSWSIAAPLQTEKLYDVTGASVFILTTLYSLLANPGGGWLEFRGLEGVHPRQVLASVMTTVWAIKLFVHLSSRAVIFGDRRFNKIKKSIAYFGVVYFIQTLWIAITNAPVVTLQSLTAAQNPQLGSLVTDYLGVGLWLLGFIWETTADTQKMLWQMRLGEKRFTEVCDGGLFKYSRYPQYFGEITLWLGQYLLCSGVFPLVSAPRFLLAGSPAFVAFLLIRVSGIRLQEQMGDKRYENNPRWKEYKATTSLLVPWFPAPRKPTKTK